MKRKTKKQGELDEGIKHGREPGKKVDEPAQEVADDEVEIGKTGSKPGTKSTPLTKHKS